MPRISSCQLSRPAASSVPPTFCVIASLMRARFRMHSRSTARLHLLEFVVLVLVPQLGRVFGTDQADELVVEAVLDPDEGRGDLDQRGFVGARASPATIFSRRSVSPCTLAAQLAQAQHAQRVADLAQQLHLRGELLRLAGAAAHEDVEHVLDLATGPRGSPRRRSA